ncbi:endonuclease/exonuclease/phosphatase family protein [Cognatiyoonia sp. IB215182]|uniref:endonuclease/exonuclease/phosphatase family protein n=1 Tax=Cognatiyoonia sp. IB215182 TaxID=3097353 RepID=UPI002A160D19|nr:endonuclease/exonuclease/phosphatase family protein [Cognatiyoonia sp. IB215182]MDX8350917.1 endonuclease/exonuclease/phosphatase family protein [Cognatiyoonia sp. IB215182]
MTRFTIASFNVKNLIEAEEEYYRFEEYTPEEYAWKRAWLADQLLTMNADIVCFQEIFSEDALRDVIIETDELGLAANEAVIPDRSKRYARKAIFRKLAYEPYTEAALAFAPNSFDGGPGQRRPGVAILSRFGFDGLPEVVQDLSEPLDIPFSDLGGDDGGSYRLSRLSRPILKVRVPVEDQVVTVFNCHLKSKLGEFPRREGAAFPPEADLVNYDAAGRAMGSLRAALRRMAEAWVLRRAILDELEAGNPVMVLGDFNDSEHAVSSEIITGEAPFKNYAWMRRHDAKDRRDRYSDEEDTIIQEAVGKVRLYSAEKLFVKKSLRDMVYTSAFGGVFESIDQILMSRHFLPEFADRIGEMEYFSVLNDHLTDGSHPEAPYNKLASDHGQIMAHMVIGDGDD